MSHTDAHSGVDQIADVLPLHNDGPSSHSSTSAGSDRILYADIGAILDGRTPEPLRPTILQRTDGHALFYPGQVNLLHGDPESGKTWVCLAAVAEQLAAGNRALMIDLDHNGVVAVVGHLLKLGVDETALRSRFRYIDPDDRVAFDRVVEDMADWQPSVVVVDSLGELIPLYGASSISPDDVTRVHRRTLKPLARSGAAVIAVDHLAKGEQARGRLDPGGTLAKSRVLGGASYRVNLAKPFAPGRGGACELVVAKDRHGGVRGHCDPVPKPVAGVLILTDGENGSVSWQVVAPAPKAAVVGAGAPGSDLERIVEEIVAAADRSGAPRNYGRDRLKEHLKDLHITASNAAWAAAAKRRKHGA
jgi:hypothetical protein